MKFFVIILFVACLLIWAVFKWLLPDYPLNESEMIAVVAFVAILVFWVKRRQIRHLRKQNGE